MLSAFSAIAGIGLGILSANRQKKAYSAAARQAEYDRQQQELAEKQARLQAVDDKEQVRLDAQYDQARSMARFSANSEVERMFRRNTNYAKKHEDRVFRSEYNRVLELQLRAEKGKRIPEIGPKTADNLQEKLATAVEGKPIFQTPQQTTSDKDMFANTGGYGGESPGTSNSSSSSGFGGMAV